MTDAIAARIVAEFGPDAGAEILALARALMPAPAAPPSSGGRPVLRVANKDVAKLSLHPVLSHKAISETVLASVCPEDPEFQAVGLDVILRVVELGGAL